MKLIFLITHLLIAATLYKGQVSNELGYIGIRSADVTGTRGVERVRHWSPADCAGIKAEDLILSCDGVVGGPIAGQAYTVADIVIRRDKQELIFHVMRLPMRIIKEREMKYYYDCGFETDLKPLFNDALTK